MPTKFDFVSPGIQLREIDQSQVTPVEEEDGLLLIGRSIKGPAMKPVKVDSLENFIDVFGNPMDGVKRNDPWRQGNTGAASYAGYAAQAYLASGVGPVKFIRLGGLNNGATLAGWNVAQTAHANTVTRATYTGSLGLFVAPKEVAGGNQVTGTLAAIFYVDGTSVALTGTLKTGVGMATNVPSASAFTLQDTRGNFNAVLNDGAATTIPFNFDKNDPNFIRNVFNTDPTVAITGGGTGTYFLGETFESQVRNLVSGSSTDGLLAFVAGIGTGDSNIDQAWSDFRGELTAAKSGWFIGAQTQQRKLFRLVALDEGEEFQKEYYICVKDIRLPSTTKPDATFTIEIRRYGQNGYVEKYSNLTLNVDSVNYISKRIGDVSQAWQEGSNGASGKIVTSGVYPNVSSLVRVEINTAISLSPSDYPFGFLGPKRVAAVKASAAIASTKGWIIGSSSVPNGPDSDHFITGAPNNYTASIEFPTHLLSTTNTYLGTRDYPPTKEFGLRYSLANGRDYTIGEVGQKRRGIDPHLAATDANSDAGYTFTLDDIRATDAASASFYYEAGSFSKTAGPRSVTAGGSESTLINLNVKQFQAPFFGGFDGTNVLLANPFNESRLDVTTGYERHTVEQALEQAADRDLIRYDLIAMPGITNEALNTDLLNQTEARGDALAIVDLNGIYQSGDDTGTGTATDQAITTVIQTINTENIDNSYGAAYYPNVRLRDTLNGNGSVLFAPPSVAAIGAIAKSEADSQPWFAPAGFQRGGLNPLGGALGPQILGTVEHLTKADRDKLYEVNINPIARFPATGDTVVFGQKTLQQDASALDRINVRRLMNYLKKEIGDIADTILFDQNIQATWNRFKTQADSVLSSVKADFGIVEYKLVLDETTTTPDLQDRNILYAKVFVKPARSIEFIAVDFVITQSGIEL